MLNAVSGSEAMCLACIHRQPIAKLKEKIIDWIFWCVWPVNRPSFVAIQLNWFLLLLQTEKKKKSDTSKRHFGERINVQIACVFRLAIGLNATEKKPMKFCALLAVLCLTKWVARSASMHYLTKSNIKRNYRKPDRLCAKRFTAIDRDDNFRYGSSS